MERIIIAKLIVDDKKAEDLGLGTLDYLERGFKKLRTNNIILEEARVLDEDDEYDQNAIELSQRIFEFGDEGD